MANDRIQEIANDSDVGGRKQRYRRLDGQLANGERLSMGEIESLLGQLSKEPLQHIRSILWRMLMRQECSPRLTHFCAEWARECSNKDRHLALRFLRECHASSLASLILSLARDSDPLVRYETALSTLNAQPRESLATFIDLFGELPLHLQEEAEMYLLEKGGPEELERIRLNSKLRGAGTSYDLLARSLESRLAKT